MNTTLNQLPTGKEQNLDGLLKGHHISRRLLLSLSLSANMTYWLPRITRGLAYLTDMAKGTLHSVRGQGTT